jgi:hypothetical protein
LKSTRRSRVSNGKTLFLDGDKGTKAERRFRDIAEAITADLGGADRLSEGQKSIDQALFADLCRMRKDGGTLCGKANDRFLKRVRPLVARFLFGGVIGAAS